jgi:hypothetical protein
MKLFQGEDSKELSVLLVEETGGPGDNLPQVTDKLYHIMV